MKAFEMLDDAASDHCGLCLVFDVGGSMDIGTERNHEQHLKRRGVKWCTTASDGAVGMASMAKCAFVGARKQKGLLSSIGFE
eukprot:1139213-Pelagomonas_calceolata.AAC.2